MVNELLLFDLQLFAEEEIEGNAGAPEEVAQDPVAEQKLTDDEIISRDVFNVSEETINDLKELYSDEFKDEPQPQEPKEPAAQPEAKQEPEPNQPVDYKAMYEKQQRELEELKARFTQPQAQPQVPAQPQTPMTNVANGLQPMAGGGFTLTPEANKLFNDLVQERTLEITGMTQEEVDTIGFLDDDDEKKQRYLNAKYIARNQIINGTMQQAYAIQQARMQEYELQRQAQVDIQNFVNEVKATPNYQEADQYITNTFLGTLSNMEQVAVRQAYERANAGCSTPQDNVILRNFWRLGLNAYNSQSNSNSPATAKTQAKMQQRNAMPRVGNITGGNTNVSEWDDERIAKALEDGNWDKIPQPVVDRYLRGL